MTPKQQESATALGESIVEEVRAIRESIDNEMGHDVRRLAAEARRVSEQIRREYGLQTAKLPPVRTAHSGTHG